ncbi:type I-B CRISPR-associated protein Cas5b [Natrinema altunense]|uniref:Type I-B CRISPR-associated protein Cas5 n=1 Tax=Natrinema altunense TaxID=222984 RepID=A0A482Y3Y5_9EURY|nr:type I-B CRISPR-associated protein Cas5b [Natrinema altunense]RZH69014.1 type I-B CRISPR-associated protein Cas5 [Natrinema altunense]
MARRDTDSEAVVPNRLETVDPPTISDGIPSKCLSFVLRSDWGHFRRIDRTVTKQTYRLPPRTTVAGMLAAIAGVRRDGYYDVFAPDNSAIAITPIGSVRTVTQPTLGLGTHPGETMIDAGGTGKKTVKVKYPDTTDNRQIHSYELLVNPAYRIDVAVEDERFYSVLKHRLETGTSYYPPSMGLSEYLAWIETPEDNRVEFETEILTTEGTVAVDSAVPDGVDDVVLQPDVRCDVERVPAYIEAHDGGRRTTGFVDYAFSDAQLELRPKSVIPTTVGDRTVVFE